MALLLILLAWHPATPLHIQQGEMVNVRNEEHVLYKGVSNRILIWMEVKEGYHIQANLTDNASVIPTTLEIDAQELIRVKSVRFPSGKKFRLEGTESFLEVYDGEFPVALILHPGRRAPIGRHILKARLRYQACDSRTCLFPRVMEFVIPTMIKVKEG